MTINPDLKPSVVLICHENDAVDTGGVAAWLAHSFTLSGIVVLRERPGALFDRLRREYRRVGGYRLLDVMFFRLFYQFRYQRADARWVAKKVRYLRGKYPADLSRVPRLVARNPNSAEVREFIAGLQPDFTLARCKYILQPDIFNIPRCGTYVLHPGICPQYRNAHGCFWALAMGDPGNVGMTLLKVDSGIDTGPIYLQASYDFDEGRESHIVIQHRVVLENLDVIAAVLRAVANDTARPIATASQHSANRGQPWFTAYLRWRHRVRA